MLRRRVLSVVFAGRRDYWRQEEEEEQRKKYLQEQRNQEARRNSQGANAHLSQMQPPMTASNIPTHHYHHHPSYSYRASSPYHSYHYSHQHATQPYSYPQQPYHSYYQGGQGQQHHHHHHQQHQGTHSSDSSDNHHHNDNHRSVRRTWLFRALVIVNILMIGNLAYDVIMVYYPGLFFTFLVHRLGLEPWNNGDLTKALKKKQIVLLTAKSDSMSVHDPFKDTVILLFKSDNESGSVGLVINRGDQLLCTPRERPEWAGSHKIFQTHLKDKVIMWGGPVMERRRTSSKGGLAELLSADELRKQEQEEEHEGSRGTSPSSQAPPQITMDVPQLLEDLGIAKKEGVKFVSGEGPHKDSSSKGSSSGDELRFGYPKDSTMLQVLHRCKGLKGTQKEILPGLFVGADLDALQARLDRGDANAENDVFLYMGFSSWAPEQLELEMARKAWDMVAVEKPKDLDGKLHQYDFLFTSNSKLSEKKKNAKEWNWKELLQEPKRSYGGSREKSSTTTSSSDEIKIVTKNNSSGSPVAAQEEQSSPSSSSSSSSVAPKSRPRHATFDGMTLRELPQPLDKELYSWIEKCRQTTGMSSRAWMEKDGTQCPNFYEIKSSESEKKKSGNKWW